MKQKEYAYIAGLIDGEGYLGLTRKDNHLWARVVISNCNLPLLKYAKSIIGGNITVKKIHNIKWTQGYNLTIPYIEKWLPHIVPYLIGKKKKAILILEAIKLNKKRKGMTQRAGNYGLVRLEEINKLLRKKEWDI